MGFFTKTFRIWWRPPRAIAAIEESREVSFLELFYDLAYVGIIYQITHAFVANLGMLELRGYVALYAMVWFAWVNGTLYHELHGNNDIRTRVFTFLQVFVLAFIAIFAPTAFKEGATGFALSYAAFMGIMTWLWWQTGTSDPDHRPLSRPYSAGFAATLLLFLGSLLVEPPLTFYLWTAGIGFALLLPLGVQYVTSVDADHHEQSMRIRAPLVERFGLLTIIVLGEAVASVMRGASHHAHIDGRIILLVILSLGVAAAMWWCYFDLVARRLPIQATTYRMRYIYLHLPVTMCIGLVAAGFLYLLEHPDDVSMLSRWLIIAPVALFLLCIKLLIQTLQVRPENKVVYVQASRAAFGAAILIVIVGLLNLSIVTTLAIILVLLLAPVYAAVRFWIERRYNAEMSQGSVVDASN